MSAWWPFGLVESLVLVVIFGVVYCVQWRAFREADARRESEGESCEG